MTCNLIAAPLPAGLSADFVPFQNHKTAHEADFSTQNFFKIMTLAKPESASFGFDRGSKWLRNLTSGPARTESLSTLSLSSKTKGPLLNVDC
jgi:hypothetical protein